MSMWEWESVCVLGCVWRETEREREVGVHLFMYMHVYMYMHVCIQTHLERKIEREDDQDMNLS